MKQLTFNAEDLRKGKNSSPPTTVNRRGSRKS
jgi:hypothetical protein